MNKQLSFSFKAHTLFGEQTESIFSICLQECGRPLVAITLVDELAKVLTNDSFFVVATASQREQQIKAKIKALIKSQPSLLNEAISQQDLLDPTRVIYVDLVKLEQLSVVGRSCVLLHGEDFTAKQIHRALRVQVNHGLISDPHAKLYLDMGAIGIEQWLANDLAGIVSDDLSKHRHRGTNEAST